MPQMSFRCCLYIAREDVKVPATQYLSSPYQGCGSQLQIVDGRGGGADEQMGGLGEVVHLHAGGHSQREQS